MRYLEPDLESYGDVVVGGADGEPYCVVEQDLVRADLDEQRRQAGDVDEDRTGRGMDAVAAPR
ncbi:hypothetical protein AQJ54_39395 [Streptomyces griseorubiginosus]|uniref:Uncharacterized protein n=1 Tax=Streptomyces griseorubiginosus TaxID=67304 RepID=A0A101RQ16_9ACTN|nr:hypothetical protein AQJ54_39395 [Streptomyces griseorubiginosus]